MCFKTFFKRFDFIQKLNLLANYVNAKTLKTYELKGMKFGKKKKNV